MAQHIQLNKEAKAWVKRNDGTGEIIRILLDIENSKTITVYLLYNAFDSPDYVGSILFDTEGYWIYDGHILQVAEQEQVARFILQYVETL